MIFCIASLPAISLTFYELHSAVMSIVCVFTAYVPALFLKIRIGRFLQVCVAIFAPFATIRVTAFLDLSARRAVAAAYAARVVDQPAVGHAVAAFAGRVVAAAFAATVE